MKRTTQADEKKNVKSIGKTEGEKVRMNYQE